MSKLNKIIKLFKIDIKSIDDEKRTIKFCFSDNSVDRQGEIVDQSSWDVKNYLVNPIILWGHDPKKPENVLGSGIELELDQGGKSFITAQFDDVETNPRADMVYRQLKRGTIRTVSAGFITGDYDFAGENPILKNNELLEVSIVPIPANPNAVSLGFRDGSITKKDAEYLLDAMRSESKMIEQQLKAADLPEGMNQKDMDELTQKIDALTNLVTPLVEQFTELKVTVEKLAPVEETEEEKTAREAKEAEDKAAADKAEADAKAQADKEAAEQAEADELAKGGSNDQSETKFSKLTRTGTTKQTKTRRF
jgi:HK97 family phage prohead protease